MKKLLILGGGTAGWMAANLLNHHLGGKNPQQQKHEAWQITLVESPQIGIIGVGEGSTPQLKKFFDLLGITESEWMPACHASYKNGISFLDWSENAQNNRYFHPFPSPFDRQTAAAFLYHCQMRSRGMDVAVNPDNFFLTAKLADLKLSPKPFDGKPQLPLNYAYHFDSGKLGEFLGKHAVANGVVHISGTMKSVNQRKDLSIQSIELESGERHEADIFIDATGFNSLLLQGALNVPFEDFSCNLFNNRAVAIPSARQDKIGSETKATALSAGWSWQIPLTNRTGNGYVFSDRYITPEKAEDELRLQLKNNNDTYKNEAKHLKMKVGQVQQHWFKNVVTVGLSQGFIEPLEATALHLVQETIQKLVASLQAPNFASNEEEVKRTFNDDIRQRFEGVRDYIVCHYKMNSRTDSDYWIDNRENTNISPKLSEVIDVWHSKKDISEVLTKNNMTQYYPVISWYCLLAGYGAFAPVSSANKLPASQMKQLEQYIMRNTKNFAPHNVSLGLEV
ncbi:tryptophan halogenase family protein [Glaciecola sp. MF2-115]|uniref:tryptophan halogenase family protein n=1 Tax=Glaciecola sp. MF2-115 TaxID=3384827 RepID=UPI0039A12948